MQGVDIRHTFASEKTRTGCTSAKSKLSAFGLHCPCNVKQLRPRLRSGNKKKMARDLMQGKRIYDRMKNQARQQLALMNRCRMHRQGGKGVVNQPFYVQFLNR